MICPICSEPIETCKDLGICPSAANRLDYEDDEYLYDDADGDKAGSDRG